MQRISSRSLGLSHVQGFSFSYCSRSLPDHQKAERDNIVKQGPSIGSPARIQKLIAKQSNPLLAKEIFDLASRQPNFRHSDATFYTLILKLGRSNHFSLMQNVLYSLKSHERSISPPLFTHIIKIYGDAKMPEKALKTFYTILEFNMKPRTKQLNCILEILVANCNFLRPALDLFKSASKYGVNPNTTSYNILMRAFSLNNKLSVAYSLFNQMFKRDVLPDVESYRILVQGLCRKGQVNTAVNFLEDMLNKGYVPDALIYNTLLNSLCVKRKLKEAYKLLCQMKLKGCNPDLVHYNTVISGFCKAGRAADACKVIEDMTSSGCLPNALSYHNIVAGLCRQGMYSEAKSYINMMMSKVFSPHFSVVHMLVKGFCNIGRVEDAFEVLLESLKHGTCPHTDTWTNILPRICEVDSEAIENTLKEVLKVEIKPDTSTVDAGAALEEYLVKRVQTLSKRR